MCVSLRWFLIYILRQMINYTHRRIYTKIKMGCGLFPISSPSVFFKDCHVVIFYFYLFILYILAFLLHTFWPLQPIGKNLICIINIINKNTRIKEEQRIIIKWSSRLQVNYIYRVDECISNPKAHQINVNRHKPINIYNNYFILSQSYYEYKLYYNLINDSLS